MQFYILLALVFALLVAIFALQNASAVGVQFFSGSWIYPWS